MKKTYVYDSQTRKLVLKPQFRCSRHHNTMILGAIAPAVSPIDGTILDDRSKLRLHNKRHGVTDSRDYGPDWFKHRAVEKDQARQGQTREDKNERIEALKYAIDQDRRR